MLGVGAEAARVSPIFSNAHKKAEANSANGNVAYLLDVQ